MGGSEGMRNAGGRTPSMGDMFWGPVRKLIENVATGDYDFDGDRIGHILDEVNEYAEALPDGAWFHVLHDSVGIYAEFTETDIDPTDAIDAWLSTKGKTE